MSRLIERLRPLQVSKLKVPGYYADGAGLYLQIAKGGSKSWVLRFTLDGRPREMGLGSCITFSLADARKRAAEQRRMIADGIDPIEARRHAQSKQRLAKSKIITFDQAADSYITAHEASWRSAKHSAQWRSTLTTYASPIIGKLPVGDVTTALVMDILSPIWTSKTETASRVRGRIEKVLDWAKVQGLRTGENPAVWKGHLAQALPKPSTVSDAGHHPALPWAEIGSFMHKLRAMPGSGSLAMQLIILTGTRTNEVINASWGEFDMEAAIWTIPKERMKGLREHRVPLSNQALSVLDQIRWDNKSSSWLFPSKKPEKAISNMTCLATLKRMGRSDLTVHGFRSTFRDWASENTNHPHDVCEMALAHAIRDKSEAAYRRGDLLEKRTQLMNDWADFCDVIANTDKVASKVRTA